MDPLTQKPLATEAPQPANAGRGEGVPELAGRLAAALEACPPATRVCLVEALSELARLSAAESAVTLSAALRRAAGARGGPTAAAATVPASAGPGLIPPHGGYEALLSYRTAEIIHDATVVFCDRFIDRRSRTHDQMVQAARSGKQNLVEGSVDSGTSKKLELKLVGVARGSLEELLRDYTDYLRQHGLALWGKDDPRARAVRRLAYAENRSYSTYETHIKDGTPEVAANTIVCLIHQANYLVGRQLQALRQAFLSAGGFTERLYRLRQDRRRGPAPSA